MENFRRDNRRSGGRAAMHKATCSKCGDSCEVPFKPTGSKPVFCSNCFEKQGGGGRSNFGGSRGGRRDRPRFSDKQMHTAVCAKCGTDCQVPFRPTAGKPVYCSNCFDKNSNGGGKSGGQSSEELRVINKKLDMIMEALGLSGSGKVKKAVKTKKPAVKKAVATKKVVKKAKVKKAVAKKKTKAKTASKKVLKKKKK